MTEQWFLDLDGTRSGPYHTPEIMSLIAEGEVLPHHRISTSLKDQAWHTILDWRLDQAKISQSTPKKSGYRSEISAIEIQHNPEEKNSTTPGAAVVLANTVFAAAPTAATPTPPAPNAAAQPAPAFSETSNSILLEIPDAKEWETSAEPTREIPRPEEEKPTPKLEFKQKTKPKRDETPKAPPPISKPPFSESSFENYPVELPVGFGPEHTEEITREIPSASALMKPPALPVDEARPKRDPMAEMFDMIQKTKQKKESKQMVPLQMGMSIEADVPGARKPSNLGKTLGIGVGIIVIGFALGQLFQNTAQPPLTEVPPAKPTPSPSSSPNAVRAKGGTETLDRSTDKLMIRANVDRRVEVPPPAPSKPIVKLVPRPTAPDTLQNEKELEELKTLKKELQELKALKTNSNPLDDISEAEGDGLDGPPGDQPPGFDANGFPLAAPANNPGGIPQNGDLNPVR